MDIKSDNDPLQLREWLQQPNTQDEWVKKLYDSYTNRFINDNNKIWSTGNIFIPLSLAGLFKLHEMNQTETWLVGIGSVILMLFWVLVAESHRAFQNKAREVANQIEREYLQLAVGPPNPHRLLTTFRFLTVQNIRWAMLVGIVIIWAVAIYYKR
ncbi:hypothetical protein MUN82_07205 [Hymenobacter aerilatus]|uniref:Uncharacterized protein n=1 Tax=Hymenobacter aerilatus TaxID=2932251 RepID=A0A8T9T2S5_9BACT|nr:hypothetical protein [Hymenobacter aerilatus]UOR06880.1 hypothetical protein MUN82_07205 [Hymenobacter aerilatus]